MLYRFSQLRWNVLGVFFLILASTFPVYAERICGNGIIDPGEFCDPGMNQPLCSTTSLSFASGTLRCQSSCLGYDTSECVTNQNAGGTNAESVIPKLRDSVKWAGATCSNGTPFSYQVSLAPVPTKNWVIYLGGGGQCDGIIFPCDNRTYGNFTPSFSSESTQTNFGSMLGIMNRSQTENPDFYNANLVLGKYCTNDMWSGTRTDPVTIKAPVKENDQVIVKLTPVVFTGRNNVRAMLESLQRYFGMDDKDPELKIMFTGSSSGGLGVNTSADLVGTVFKKTAKARRVYVVSSAGSLGYSWNNPTYTLNDSGYSDEESFDIMANQYQSQYAPDCEVLAASDGKKSSVCLSGYYSYTTMAKKLNYHVMLHRNILDQVYMSNHNLPPEKLGLSSDEIAARRAWATGLDNEFKKVKWFWSPRDATFSSIDPLTGLEVLEENFHGVYTSGYWAQTPPVEMSANVCGYTPPVSFQQIINHLWNDTSTSYNNDVGERYCYEGNWIK